MLETIIGRMNPRAIALFIAFVLSVGGLLLIYFGIKDDGFIDLKSAVLEGKIRSGLVGVTIIFLSVFLSSICVLTADKHPKQPYTIEILKGDHKITWSGSSKGLGGKFISMLQTIDFLDKNEAKSNNDKI